MPDRALIHAGQELSELSEVLDFQEAAPGNQAMVTSAQEGRDTRHDEVIDRRLTVRYASEHQTFVQPSPGNSRVLWRARVRDISDNGMGLILHQAFESGVELWIELPAEGN